MRESRVFCECCRKDVSFIVTSKQLKGTIKGDDYTYLGQIAHCDTCGSEIYVSAVNDYNLKLLYDEYRVKHDIVSLDTILQISKKYAIGKRPLSLLLGWGEQTFSRYCDGDLPTKQYSDIIKRIDNDPRYYNQILEANKNKLNSEKTYQKSKMAVEAKLNGVTPSNTKIDLATKYLLSECEDITPLALQKVLYYIQGFYHAFYKELLFIEDCQAWMHGPVYSAIYAKYHDYRFDPNIRPKKKEDIVLTSSERAVFESVAKHICCYSAKTLEKFTHSELPWIIARKGILSTETSNIIISKNDIADYFDNVKEKYNMSEPDDIKLYAEDLFQQIK